MHRCNPGEQQDKYINDLYQNSHCQSLFKPWCSDFYQWECVDLSWSQQGLGYWLSQDCTLHWRSHRMACRHKKPGAIIRFHWAPIVLKHIKATFTVCRQSKAPSASIFTHKQEITPSAAPDDDKICSFCDKSNKEPDKHSGFSRPISLWFASGLDRNHIFIKSWSQNTLTLFSHVHSTQL